MKPILRKRVAPNITVPLDATLITMARQSGCAVFPLLELKPSNMKRGALALYVAPNIEVPDNYPLALIPNSAFLSINTVLDADRSNLLPSVPEIASVLQETDHVDMIDSIVLAMFLSLQMAEGAVRQRATSWTAVNVNTVQVLHAMSKKQPSDDDLLLESFSRECHELLEGVFPITSFALFHALMRYVVGALSFVGTSEESDPSAKANEAAVIAPVLDVVSNKWGAEVGNVKISKVDVVTAKEVARDAPLLGARNSFRSCCPQEEFFVLSSSRCIRANEGTELYLPCPQMPKDVSKWTALDRIRFGK